LDKELLEEYMEEVNSAGNLPDSAFPDFIWSVSSNIEFGDSYLEMAVIDDPRARAIGGLRRKYNTIQDYEEALDIYQDYLEYLDEKYGDYRAIMESIKMGITQEMYKPEPRLRSSRKNKQYLKTPHAVSMVAVVDGETYKPDKGLLQRVEEQIPFTEEDLEEVPEHQMIYTLSKKEHKQLRLGGKKFAAMDRVKGLLANAENRYGVNIMLDYFQELSTRGYDGKGNKIDRDSFSELLTELEREEDVKNAVVDEMQGYVRDEYGLSLKEKNQIEFIKQLTMEGWTTKGTKKGLSARGRKVVDSETRPYHSETMSKKELKKYKKKTKKDKEKLSISNAKAIKALMGQRGRSVGGRSSEWESSFSRELKNSSNTINLDFDDISRMMREDD
jgi:hypothetical protein